MDVFEYARLRKLYGEVYSSRQEEVQEEEQEPIGEALGTLGDALGNREDPKKVGKAELKPAKPSGYSGAGSLGTTGDALGGRMVPKAPAKKMGGLPADYKETEKKAFDQAAKFREKNPAKKTSGSGGSSAPTPTPTPTPKPTSPPKDRMAGASKDARMAAWAKANKGMISKSGTSKQKDILSKATAPKPEVKPTPKPEVKPTPKPTPAASKPMSRIDKATTGIKPFKPVKEDFDIILDHLVESGFGPDEALRIMVEMPAEKRQQILEKELSIKDQMRISQEFNRKSPEEKKASVKKAMGDRPKAEPKKDERTDAQKMADATGPRKGSRYRGD